MIDMDKFKDLLTEATNASFDCGEHGTIEDSDSPIASYAPVLKRANDARERLIQFVQQSLSVPEAAIWISCDERMPAAMKDVLFWDGTSVGLGYKFADDPDDRLWYDKLATDRDGDYYDVYTVTHWMPLPEKPIAGPQDEPR